MESMLGPNERDIDIAKAEYHKQLEAVLETEPKENWLFRLKERELERAAAEQNKKAKSKLDKLKERFERNKKDFVSVKTGKKVRSRIDTGLAPKTKSKLPGLN